MDNFVIVSISAIVLMAVVVPLIAYGYATNKGNLKVACISGLIILLENIAVLASELVCTGNLKWWVLAIYANNIILYSFDCVRKYKKLREEKKEQQAAEKA